jgi:hypothetical protein
MINIKNQFFPVYRKNHGFFVKHRKNRGFFVKSQNIEKTAGFLRFFQNPLISMRNPLESILSGCRMILCFMPVKPILGCFSLK